MTPPDAGVATPPSDLLGEPSRAARTRADAPPTGALLWQALLLGISADTFLRDGPVGPGLAAWVAILSLATLSLTWRAGRRLPRETQAWLVTAILVAMLTAWRDTEALQVLDCFTVVGSLGMAAVSLRNTEHGLLARRLRDTIWAALVIVRTTAGGIAAPLLRRLAEAERDTGISGRATTVARAALIAGVLLFVFGSLLRSADPIFARLVALPALDVESLVSHVFLIGFFTWVAGGWARGALMSVPTASPAPDRMPVTLGALDVSVALGTMTAIFGAFVLTQLGWFFGGERFLHATTGLTAAEYARQGFFQMVWVVLLVVGLLLATRAALRPEPGLARRHTMLAIPVVLLLGAIIVSAATRMRLYVHYYGLTTDRLYTLIFMAWLTAVLVLLAATVLRDRGRLFVAGSVLSGAVALFSLHLVVPDRLVARVNIDRAASTSSDGRPDLDLRHLASLSGDAADLAVSAVLLAPTTLPGTAPHVAAHADRCGAASTLLDRWGPTSHAVERRERDGAWRRWNAGASHALRVVGASSSRIRQAVHESCSIARAARPRRG